MCGIFGIITRPDAPFDHNQLHPLIDRLFLLSESRGKDSAGLVLVNSEAIRVYKRPERARQMIRSAQYKAFVRDSQGDNGGQPVIVMGHARMVTNGRKEFHNNNQPVIKDGMVCIHNGIIVNDLALWQQYPHLKRQHEVDTEVLLSLIRQRLERGVLVVDAVVEAMRLTQGANSIALLLEEREGIVLATTNGSLFYALSDGGDKLVFASEAYILRQAVAQPVLADGFQNAVIHQIHPCEGYIFCFDDLVPHPFSLNGHAPIGSDSEEILPERPPRQIEDITGADTQFLQDAPASPPDMLIRQQYPPNDGFIHHVNTAVSQLRRCTRCILPETFPFIAFDDDGVCNYCRAYQPVPFKGEEALRALVAPHRRAGGKPDVLVPLSGGRDSSYGIHYIKNVLGMNPVAYTYDWGLVTDLARRNISRMCGQLGIEHILISADIKTKRENVRKNVVAWFKRPALGTVPLFMAGDKQFFYYSNLLKRQMGIGIVLYSINPLERTDFKYGFAGVNKTSSDGRYYYSLPFAKSLHFMAYYGAQFLANPHYINQSLLDTMGAFASYYFIPKDYHILYEYLRWDEAVVNATLLGEYDWETATDTESTWRIGDGTASFYNYIYYTAAGFSENDTFRSNQIREGMIDRDSALQLAQRDNQPRYESMCWYAETIGFDFEAAIRVINAMPKCYEV